MRSYFYWTSGDQYSYHDETTTDIIFNFSGIRTNTTSVPVDCLVLQFEEFIPWDNPDNIVSYKDEDLIRMLKDLVFLPFFCLVGCPANLINMAVFYKQGLKERINVCLFALSLADGLYLSSNMLWYGEQLQLRFTTREKHGPVMRFMTNNNILGLYGFVWVSQVLSGIIAADRCFCVLQPLRSQTLLRTSTMTVIIVLINIIIVGLFSLVVTRYRIACAYNPLDDIATMAFVSGDFYLRHHKLIEYLDVFVFGAGLPGVVIVVVVTTTIVTSLKLRQAATWRAGTSSSSGLSQREIALTKMLVANSVFFISCLFPFVVLKGYINLVIPEMNIGRRYHNFFIGSQWILMIISYLNSSFNIVVYYTMGSRYRQTFWQLFGKRDKKEGPQNRQ